MTQVGTKRKKYDLSTAFTERVPWNIRTLVIDKYDGAEDTCFIQFGETADQTQEEIEHHKPWTWPDDREVWIVNTAAQSGKTLKISVGGPGTFVGTGSAYYGSAVPNKASFITGQVTVGTSEADLSASSVAVPNGFAAVIRYMKGNTGEIYVSVTGVSVSTGYQLSQEGDFIGLYITDLNTIKLIASAADQKVCYAVEQPS